MSRILLRDLEPGRLYHIQARATNGEQSSQWSQLWDLQTTSDIMPPAVPTALSWVVEGTAFKAVWTGPTTNQDGSTLRDFKDFQVKIYSPANSGVVATYYTTSARFDLPFELNVNALGTPRAQVVIEVRARDNTGNLSVAATATATNPAPANVAGFVATGITDAIHLKWDANADTDLKYYQVYQGTSSGAENTLVYTGLSNSFVFDTISTNPQYFKIFAVDVFNTQSATAATASATAKSSLAVDVNPPNAPTGVTVVSNLHSTDPTGGTAFIDVSWTGVADTDLQNYVIRYASSSTTSSWQYVEVPEGVVEGRIHNLRAGTSYYIAVAAVDYSGNQSAWTNAGTFPITTPVDTTAPVAPTGVTVGAGVTTMTVYWNENTEGDVKGGIGYYQIQLDTANTFNTANLISKQTSGTITSFSNLTSNTVYYTRVRAVDLAGNLGAWSSIVSGTPRYIANADIQAGTINGDRITAATINGDRVTANTLDADRIKANTTFTQNLNVGATFTMATAGIMQSANYAAGVAGWRLTNNTLEINQGTIKAAALALQDSANVMHPAYADFEFVPSWYTGRIASYTPSGTVTWSIATVTDVVSRFNTQCLKIVKTGTDGVGADVQLSSGIDNYNTEVEANSSYIYSAYVYNATGSGVKNFELTARLGDGTYLGPIATLAVPATSTWTRLSGVINTGVATNLVLYMTLKTNGTIFVDGIQLEKQMTSVTTPSQWKPPGQTKIDGGIIRTGEIRSTATADGLSGQPAWSINMAGNAQLGDANVRGRLVVGDPSNPSADGVNSRIYSANYVAGSTGWIIRNDGYAEFRNIAVNSIKVTAFDSPFQNAANAKLFDYMQDGNLWLTYGAVLQKTDPGAYSAESLFEFTGPGVVLRNGTGVQRIAYDPTILYRISARIRAYDVATLNANSTFETNLTGWWNYASTTITRDTTKKYAGVASMAMAQNAASTGLYGAGTTVPVKAGRTYTFNARVLPNTTVVRDNLKMNISWLNVGGTEIAVTYNDMAPPVDGSGNPIPIDGTTWVQFSSQGVAPVGAVSANFELQCGIAGVATAGTLGWFDDVTITTPPRVKIGLFGFDNSNNIIDYDFVDVATTPTKIHAMPTDLSLLDDYAPNQYMMVANDEEVQIATGSSATTSDWITVTGYIKGRGGSGATGKFGTNTRAGDAFNPAAFNQEVRYMVPYVEWDIATGSKAQLDQFSIEAFENGAPAKVDTNGESTTMKSVSIENIQDGTEFDHALRFYSGEIDEKQPGMIGHITDGESNDAGHLRIVPPLLNRLSDYNSGPYIGIWDQNPNYLYDASFKNGITGWTGMANTTVSHETAVGREDTNALKITAVGTISSPSTTELLGKYSVSTLVNQELIGQQVTVSGYAMMGTATGRNVRLVVKFMNEAGSMISGYFIEKAVTNTGWVYYAFITPVVVPDTCYNIEFSFSWFNGATGDIVYVDDVQLEANVEKTDFRSASASKIELNAEVTRSRGPIIISESDFILPTNIIGSGGKPDVGSYKGVVAQTEYGTAAWRMVGYTDSNGTRASNNVAFFGPDGDEQAAVRLYGLNDASFPGQVAVTSPNGSFALVTQPALDGSYPYDTRVYGSLIVDGPLQWQALTSSAVTPFDAGRALGVAKQNGMLIFRGAGSWSGTAGSSGTVIFTLPVGYRPASPQYMCALMWNGNSWSSGVAFHVKTNGECILWSPPEGAGLGTSLSIEGLHCNMTAITTVTPPGSDTTAPAVPTGFAISAVSSGTSTGSYKLSWTNPSTSDVKGVKIIWRSDRYPTVTIAGSGTKTLTTDGTIVTVAGTASQAKTYTHSGLPVNKTIYYRVVSYDAAGNHSTYVSASRYLLASPVTISPSSSGSYRLGYGGMWRNDGDEVYQGDWTGNDNHRGLYFYGSNIYSKLSTGGVVRTPTKVTIYLKRLSTSHGNNAGVGINLRGHLYQSKPSGDPVGGMTNEGSDGDDIVFLSRGEAATVTVPSSWYNNIVDSTAANRIEGFGVYGSTTSDYAVLFGKSSGSSYGKLTIYHNG